MAPSLTPIHELYIDGVQGCFQCGKQNLARGSWTYCSVCRDIFCCECMNAHSVGTDKSCPRAEEVEAEESCVLCDLTITRQDLEEGTAFKCGHDSVCGICMWVSPFVKCQGAKDCQSVVDLDAEKLCFHCSQLKEEPFTDSGSSLVCRVCKFAWCGCCDISNHRHARLSRNACRCQRPELQLRWELVNPMQTYWDAPPLAYHQNLEFAQVPDNKRT
uniref:Uncharacterized protein n=2 Tax=Palpitomonas bilix TaxID=652834 RepID=A0A7S3CXA0_9EUKA